MHLRSVSLISLALLDSINTPPLMPCHTMPSNWFNVSSRLLPSLLFSSQFRVLILRFRWLATNRAALPYPEWRQGGKEFTFKHTHPYLPSCRKYPSIKNRCLLFTMIIRFNIMYASVSVSAYLSLTLTHTVTLLHETGFVRLSFIISNHFITLDSVYLVIWR